MARVCVRDGCRKRIGYNQIFCSAECRSLDKQEKVQLKRAAGKRRYWIKIAGVKVGVVRMSTAFEMGKLKAQMETALAYPKALAAQTMPQRVTVKPASPVRGSSSRNSKARAASAAATSGVAERSAMDASSGSLKGLSKTSSSRSAPAAPARSSRRARG